MNEPYCDAETAEAQSIQGTDRPASGPAASVNRKADEILRGLWANLFYSGRATDKVVLISSADRREGASTVAAGLAIVAAQANVSEKIALVDFNLRHPLVHSLLGLSRSPGVSEAMTGACEPADAAQPLNDAMDVYCAGQSDARVIELLRSAATGEFLRTLRDRYDRILLDVAAVNHYPDAQVLASVAPQAVLVARSDDTPREAVGQAQKHLASAGGKLLGVVLNMRSYPIPGFVYRRV